MAVRKPANLTFPPGNGEMATRVREYDWSQTPLGPIEHWSVSLRTTVAMVLENRFPMLLWRGPELIQIYNDGYVPILADKHPRALGRPGSEVWAEIWDTIGPQVELVLGGQGATWNEHLLLLVRRRGFPEEAYFTFSYSPVRDDDGAIGGTLVTVQETTEQVRNERQMQMLRALGTGTATSAEDVCRDAAAVLARNAADLPFALLYLVDDDNPVARLVAAAGGPGAPDVIPLDADDTTWPLDLATSSRVVEDLSKRTGSLPTGPWSTPPERAVVVSLRSSAHARAYGFLVAGVSPVRNLDETYHRLYQAAADQISRRIADARAFAEQQRRVEALGEIDRAKTAFFSNVSHEFRTPLTLMLGPTEDALAAPDGALRGEALKTVYRNELRMLKLVNALLDFARIEAGRIVANPEPLDLATLTADVASGFRSAMERAGLQFDVDTSALAGLVCVDRAMWEMIVLNLLSNALKFTREGRIQLSLRPVDDEVELVVTDTGTGITAHELPRLFERFHRIENPAARTQEGSGIGLALVQELARLQGGHVSVESEVGRGSTFRVRIPRRAAPPEIAIPERHDTVPHAAFIEEAESWTRPEAIASGVQAESTARILLVDDNADMRDYVRRLLERHWLVTAVADGRAALASARAEPPDLVLSDIMMPGLDGFELLTALRSDARMQGVPVILLSARAGDERVEGLAAGADDYLVKPFSARELVARIRTHLALANARRRAERNLEELYALMMQIPVAITVHRGFDLRCVFQNAAARELIDELGRPMRDVWPQASPEWFSYFERVLQTGLPHFVQEVAMTRAWTSGEPPTTRFWDMSFAPVRTLDGDLVGVMSLAFEVTDRVLARRQVEAFEKRRRLAFDAAGVGTWRFDLATMLETRDSTFNRILGLPEVETTQPLDDFESRIHPDDRARVVAAIARSLEHGTDYEMESRIVRTDGKVRWLRDLGRILRDEQGVPIAFTGAAADITERIVAEEQTRVASQRLHAALAASAIGTYYWDVRTNHVEYDSGAKRLLECSPDMDDAIEITATRIHEDDRAAWLAALATSARDGADFLQQYRVVLPDRSVRWLLDKGQVVRDAQNAPAYMIGAVVDITEQKQLAEAALAASRAKDEFLAMLGHELRNPLAPIATALELMKMRGSEPSKEQATIERQVQHLTRLVDDLLDISRVTRGLIELKRERVSIHKVLAKAVEIASPMVEQKQHHLTIAVPSGLVVDGDPTRLAQVFANLLTNAARYTPEGGHIEVTAAREDDRIRVRVRDDGMGIPVGMTDRIFELFEQGGNRSIARSQGGLGIGLALVRNLVRLHGGRVAARSEGPGRGSVFEIDLPTARAEAASAIAARKEPPEGHRHRILVVDDNVDAADMLSAVLTARGHTVAAAHDGPQALALAAEFAPDTAILDIGLPVMDGYELGRRLRATSLERGRLIALSGYGQEQDRSRSEEAGFDAHLVKPVDLELLMQAVEKPAREAH